MPSPEPNAVCDRCGQEIPGSDDDYGDPDNWYEHLCAACLGPASAEADTSNGTNVAAQEETCSALWDFARALGVSGTDAETSERIRNALPLRRIVRAFGFNLAEIQ